MNYFSHFVFDHIPHNSEYNCGLLLPDITRKTIKKFYQPNSKIELSSFHVEFLNGCLKHYESDKKFHSSDFFNNHYAILNHQISHTGKFKNVERKWFISHVVLELLIDRVIVRYDQSLLDNFYFSLKNTDEINLSFFLKFYGMKNIDDFFMFFNHFRSTQYIYHYTDNIKFMYSLNRIMMRANVKELTQNDSQAILDIILNFELKYFSNPVKMLNEMKEIF